MLVHAPVFTKVPVSKTDVQMEEKETCPVCVWPVLLLRVEERQWVTDSVIDYSPPALSTDVSPRDSILLEDLPLGEQNLFLYTFHGLLKV